MSKKKPSAAVPAPAQAGGHTYLGHALRVFLAFLILAATVFTLDALPPLLHPLFGGIPTRLYLGTVRSLTMFAGGGAAFLLLEGALRFGQGSSLEGPMTAFALSLFAVPFLVRSLAVAGGQAWGPRYGPVAPLSVLHVGVTASGLWAAMAPLALRGEDVLGNPIQNRKFQRLGLTSLLVLKAMQRVRPYLKLPFQAQATEGTICRLAMVFAGLAVLVAVMSPRTAPASTSPARFTIPRVALFTVALLAVQRHLFALPSTPYTAIPGRLRILHAAHSVTGLVVVGENIKDGYRFLRCDHSLLGGRFLGKTQGLGTELGDSIFSTFLLQEAVRLATPPKRLEDPHVIPQTLFIGLGAGIAADAMIQHGHAVDIVEIDPEVYTSAQKFLGLSLDSRKVILNDAAAYVRDLAQQDDRIGTYDYVIHDCFTGGSVPHEVFTVEFFADLKLILQADAVVAVNFAGAMDSRATTTVMRTLVSSFAHCRAFSDAYGSQETHTGTELMNLVIFCTPAIARHLEFRATMPKDLLGSEMRRRVMSDFESFEMDLSRWRSAVGPHDLLRRGDPSLDIHQTDSAIGTWDAMRAIMPVDLWRAY